MGIKFNPISGMFDLVGDAGGGGVTFPIYAPDGSAASPSYNFAGDTGLDTGMFHPGDGVLAFSANAVQILTITTSGIQVNGTITADNFPLTGSPNHMATFNNTGDLISDGNFGLDVNSFNGISWNHQVIPAATTDYHNLHYVFGSFNPTVPNSKETWQNFQIQSGVGTDDSGNQVGDYVDIKSTLILQDLTYTSKRYGADGNIITIAYIAGGTAGSEVVTNIGFDYTVQIQDTVSTATQIKAALDAYNPFTGSVSVAVSGTGSNSQTIVSPTNLNGGVNADGGVFGAAVDIYSRNKSNIGRVNGIRTTFDFGNGTDVIHSNSYSAYSGNMSVHDNADVQSVSVFEYALGTGNTNSGVINDVRGFNLYGHLTEVGGGMLPIQMGIQLDHARYMNVFQSSMQVANIDQSVNILSSFDNFSGDIGDNYYGVAIQPNINTVDGFFGINIAPNVTSGRQNSTGVNVNMGNVHVAAGTKGYLTIQDLFLEALVSGTGINNIDVEYINDGTAGSETANIVGGTHLQVHMQSGVSTANQIKTALEANFTVLANISITVSGVGSNPQVTQAPTLFNPGTDGGSKVAAQFNDAAVNINNGQLNSNYTLETSAVPLQFVYGMNNVGGQFHVVPGHPINSGQFGIGNNLGINLNIEDDISVDATGFNLGFSMDGILTQVQISPGKTMDTLNFMSAAASIPAGSGSLTNLVFYRAIGLIPQGGTINVTNAYGFKVESLVTATSPINAWGFWNGDTNTDNWFSKNVIIGGITGKPTGAYALDVTGDTVLGGVIYSTDTGLSIDTNNRYLINSSGVNTVEWGAGYLRDNSGQLAVSFASRVMYDNTAANSLDWDGRNTYDASGNVSIHWDGRTLTDAAANSIVEWRNGLGFFGITPVTQQVSSGPQTAGVVYTATEQTMIQQMYDALRAYGLLS